METSTRLSLPYVMEAQAQKHVTVNETFRKLDALLHLAVRSRVTATEPASPDQGEAYILPAGKTGAAWGGFGELSVAAYQDNAWMEFPPFEGMTAYIADEGVQVIWGEGGWRAVSGEEAARFGVNASPDDTNRLSVKSDAVLFSHDDITPGTGDMRLVLNKQAMVDTASLIFQTAFSGRVEMGLTGTDDFAFRVSANGSDFVDAIVIDHQTGEVSFPQTAITGGVTAPAWVPSGASFAISAEEGAIWTAEGGPNTLLLSPNGASFTGGSNPLVLSVGGGVSTAPTGAPRRSYDGDEAVWGYATGADVPLLSNGAPVPPAVLGMGLAFDFEVDPVSGDDGNDGTPAAPFATLGALQAALSALADGVSAHALIRAGDYVDDPFQGAFPGNDFTLVFEPGSTIRSTETGMVSTQGIDVTAGSVTIYGNGLHIRHYKGLEEIEPGDYLNSSNGVAVHNSGAIRIHDTRISACGDGLTGHADGRIEAYRCQVDDCDKYAVGHIDNATSYHEDCTFIGGDGHGGTGVRDPYGIAGAFRGTPGDHQFVRCRFLPSPNGQTHKVDGMGTAAFRACQFGSTTEKVTLKDADIEDSFVHFHAELSEFSGPMTRCYGRATIRLREAGSATPVLTDCVFVGAADGEQDHFLYTNADLGGFGQITVQDCVLTGYAEAIDLHRPEAPGYWQASGAAIASCTFHGNTADFDTNAAAEIGSTITAPVYTDPQLGSYAGTEEMAPYAAGAGTDGFTAQEVVVTGPPEAEDDSWIYNDASALGLSNGQRVRFTATDGTYTDEVVAGGTLPVPPGHWKRIHGPV